MQSAWGWIWGSHIRSSHVPHVLLFAKKSGWGSVWGSEEDFNAILKSSWHRNFYNAIPLRMGLRIAYTILNCAPCAIICNERWLRISLRIAWGFECTPQIAFKAQSIMQSASGWIWGSHIRSSNAPDLLLLAMKSGWGSIWGSDAL